MSKSHGHTLEDFVIFRFSQYQGFRTIFSLLFEDPKAIFELINCLSKGQATQNFCTQYSDITIKNIPIFDNLKKKGFYLPTKISSKHIIIQGM